MRRVLLAFARRTAVGLVLIGVGVPMLQGQVLNLAQARAAGPELSVTGDVTGLSPDHPGRLVLTVHNAGDTAAVVHRLSTSVRSANSGCTLTVAPWRGTLAVPAGGAASQAVAVQVAGARCGGAHWTLDYSATG
jgi:hypothetical protein